MLVAAKLQNIRQLKEGTGGPSFQKGERESAGGAIDQRGSAGRKRWRKKKTSTTRGKTFNEVHLRLGQKATRPG